MSCINALKFMPNNWLSNSSTSANKHPKKDREGEEHPAPTLERWLALSTTILVRWPRVFAWFHSFKQISLYHSHCLKSCIQTQRTFNEVSSMQWWYLWLTTNCRTWACMCIKNHSHTYARCIRLICIWLPFLHVKLLFNYNAFYSRYNGFKWWIYVFHLLTLIRFEARRSIVNWIHSERKNRTSYDNRNGSRRRCISLDDINANVCDIDIRQCRRSHMHCTWCIYA